MTGHAVPPFVHEALPGRIVFGVGRLVEVEQEVARLGGSRVMVVASPSSKRVADEVADRLGSRVVARHDDVEQHVPARLAERACDMARHARADLVVTVGGGSATGLGKAMVLDLDVPLVAVPTTYSGSEVTPIYGITGEHKRTGRDLRVLPRAVVYDPALTLGLPPGVTATTGMNAMAHCVEAFYAPGTTPVAALFAEEGLGVLATGVPRSVQRPDDIDARTHALYGSYLAGTALALAGTGLHHKACHVLGGSFGLVHGEVNAVVLPYVVAFNGPAVPEALERMARALGSDDVAGTLWDLARRMGTPRSLAELGLDAGALPEAAARTVDAVTGNPRPLDRPAAERLLHEAFRGERPTTSPDSEEDR